MTGASALKAIRSTDIDGEVALFSAETNPPYARPPLTKGLWQGKPLEKIWRKIDYPGVDVFLNTSVIKADPSTKVIEDDQGNEFEYGSLLLATGGRPRRLNTGGDEVIYYRTLADYYQLRALTSSPSNVAIIGGGFIGSELAASLCQNGSQVTMFLAEDGLAARVLPAALSKWLADYYRSKGVEVLTGEKVKVIVRDGGAVVLKTESGLDRQMDAVAAGIGIVPEIALAESAGLKTSDGIEVDSHLQASSPLIYAAGDAASFFNPVLGRRLRVEHEDNSVAMGWTAGLNMTGKTEIYDHLPFFYSDMFDLSYEAVGELDPGAEIIADWIEPDRKGVLYYIRENLPRGILLWNVWNKVDAARKIIADQKSIPPSKFKGLLTT